MSKGKAVVVVGGNLTPSEAFKMLKERGDNLTVEEKALAIGTLLIKAQDMADAAQKFLNEDYLKQLDAVGTTFVHTSPSLNGGHLQVAIGVEEKASASLTEAEKEIIRTTPSLAALYVQETIIPAKVREAVLNGTLILGGKVVTPITTKSIMAKVTRPKPQKAKGTKSKAKK